MKHSPEILRKEVEKELPRIGVRIVGQLKLRAPRDRGTLANAHAWEVDKRRLQLRIFNRKKYALYQSEGIGPQAVGGARKGKFPWGASGNPLKGWVRRRGIADKVQAAFKIKKRQTAINAAAFLVGRAIKEKGVRANRWFRGTIRSMRREVMSNMADVMTKTLILSGEKARREVMREIS